MPQIATILLRSLITKIYIAPLQGNHSEAFPILARIKSWTVFRQ